jgi:hypothetical protein
VIGEHFTPRKIEPEPERKYSLMTETLFCPTRYAEPNKSDSPHYWAVWLSEIGASQRQSGLWGAGRLPIRRLCNHTGLVFTSKREIKLAVPLRFGALGCGMQLGGGEPL